MSGMMAALERFVADDRALLDLGERLNRFNIFDVLGASQNELRHSSMLFWLFDPRGTHGFESRFLHAWMETVGLDLVANPATVRIRRELSRFDRGRESRIDLLLEFDCVSGHCHVVCVENKIGARQSDGQLARYHRLIEREFKHAKTRHYFLLSRDGEEPDLPAFQATGYAQVLLALERSLEGQLAAPEPAALLDSYRDLLREQFVTESPTRKLALDIYDRHSHAIDYIISVREDVLRRTARLLDASLADHTEALGIVVDEAAGGTILRFLPQSWDAPPNQDRGEHASETRYVWWEIALHSSHVRMEVVCGYAPRNWLNSVWAMADQPPFQRVGTGNAKDYVRLHRVVSPIKRSDIETSLPPENAGRVLNWAMQVIRSDEFRAIEAAVASRIPALERA